MQPAVMTAFALYGLMTLTESISSCMSYRMLKTRSTSHPDHNEKECNRSHFCPMLTVASYPFLLRGKLWIYSTTQKQKASRRKSIMTFGCLQIIILYLFPKSPCSVYAFATVRQEHTRYTTFSPIRLLEIDIYENRCNLSVAYSDSVLNEFNKASSP